LKKGSSGGIENCRLGEPRKTWGRRRVFSEGDLGLGGIWLLEEEVKVKVSNLKEAGGA